jgi:uncharacterized protein YkwD
MLAPPNEKRAVGRHRRVRHAGRRLALLVIIMISVAAPATAVLGAGWLRQPPPRGTATGVADTDAYRRAALDRASRSTTRTAPAAASPSASTAVRSASASPSTALHTSPAAGGAVIASPASSSASRYERAVAAAINKARAQAGCGPLRYDSRLAAAARSHSADMAKRGYFDHNTPSGVTPWARDKAEGYTQPSAENIAAGQTTPSAAVSAWMHSSGHRHNILNCSSHATGVGFYRGGSYGYYWTQEFGYQ